MDKKTQINVWYLILTGTAILLFQNWWITSREVEVMPYSEFETLLEQGGIAEVSIHQDRLEGKLKTPLKDGRQYFVTTRVDPQLADRLAAHKVTFSGVVESTFLRDLLSWVLPVLFFFGLWMFFIRRMAEKQGFGGLMTVGKSKAKIYVEKDTRASFDDVAGVEEAKDELREIVAFLKQPKEYGRLGARVPKGVLLVGPPGTGKTLLARAVAGEAGVPFFSISGSEFVEMFVGVGAARVRDLFAQAAKAAPCIIFIDELDALGRARGFGTMGGHDEKEQTLNQLLSELDGFDPQQGIVLLAATNRPEILDPALLRAGRFDRQVLVDRPDKVGRLAILQIHLKQIRLGTDVRPEQVAELTPGFSGADLATLVNEAALLATRRGADAVAMDDFNQAVERIVAGLEKKNRLLNPDERRVVAYHEMGHALVAKALPGMDPVHKISIIPRGIGALGYTIQRPTEERYLMTKAELEHKMSVLYGGRAAEMVVFGEVSTGAADDLQKITDIARSMVLRFGMADKLGQIAFEQTRRSFLGEGIPDMGPKDYSEETAREIDCAVRELTNRARDRAVSILEANRSALDAGAQRLLESETLLAADIPEVVALIGDGARPEVADAAHS
ncbi:MAG: ATP-dependent zinc metalloprotease FtsH [Chromatiaceae bacterium]|nr:ATP-dependent zinc metalloprotease FtsH [Chromatiaceae bacterium]